MRGPLVAGLVLVSILNGVVPTHAAPKYATYHINYVYLTPYKIQATTSLDEFTKADKGEKFLVVTFHALNKDDVQQEIEVTDMKASVGGRSLDEDFSDPTPALNGQVMEPGGHLDGGVAFQVPSNAHNARIVWSVTSMMLDVHWPSYAWNVTF